MKRVLFVSILSLLINYNASSQSLTEKSETQKVKVIGHAHMDPVYRWRWNEIERREIYNTFSNVLQVMDERPNVHFAQSSLVYYDVVQKNFPDLFEQIKQSIKDKRWSLVGGQWVETDETMPSGESLIRQFLVGRDYYSKNLGIENIHIAWSPDAFTGHIVTLPKIYSGCGIDTYVFSRNAPEGKKVFWWESKDGSRLLAYKIPDHYNPDFKRMPDYIKDWVDVSGYDSPMVTIGEGDHGGGPKENDFLAMQRLSDKANLEFEFVSPENYFNELRQVDKEWPVLKTEFSIQPRGGQWQGCYTSQARIKKLNRYHENKLLTTEKFSVIGCLNQAKPFYPREDFKDAWRILLFNQFHDVIPGTLAGLGVNDVYKDYEKLDKITSEQLTAGLEIIGSRINTENIKGTSLVVYNPHSWSVSQYIEADFTLPKKVPSFRLKDSTGKNVPYSILKESEDGLQFKIAVQAENVPALGYKVYEIVEENPGKAISDIKVGTNQIENSHYIIKWDNSGVSSIFSKKLKGEVLEGTGNKMELLEDHGNAWGTKLTGKEFKIEPLKKPEIIFQSPLQVVLKWEDNFQSSNFTRYMTLNADSNQIDFKMEVDWHSHNKILQVVFPTGVEKGDAFYSQPYGYIQRAETGKYFPAHKWIDCSNNNWGVSLLNDGKYGFTITEGKLVMSVVRGARGMDPRTDEGMHSFKYALIAHEGDWKDADIPLRALEHNQTLIANRENHHPGQISGWFYNENSYPLEKSFFGIDSDHVIISSLKTRQDAYHPDDIILRIVETEGREEDVTVQLPYNVSSVIECNHLEQPIEPRSTIEAEGKEIRFKIGRDQIRTFMINFNYKKISE
ncbi:glycoside hydrolase family 38 C-terminal domain-containing protein [Flavivirga sp. 57AJ16]|uniref:alpha-mannosidase n=1 Tax=Flavivirga sp. 57AJ16 TaxID=3025307 RepID=UPI002365E00C|nr:glycoside hydrolase family 38 C-terminal domain-containing protein [Flavivirga sp. 57AJ16]MDD7885447.1 glycoside hydrolase family 38 C-terminal domain-containing protein [Flavivirga sp. 57AJ16]